MELDTGQQGDQTPSLQIGDQNTTTAGAATPMTTSNDGTESARGDDETKVD